MKYEFSGTPGPWKYNVMDEMVLEDNGILSYFICKVVGGFDDQNPNGHLISAAPDLLEALKDCITHISAVLSPSDVPESAVKAIQKALNIKP